jgi:hypothetical protein
MAEGGTAMKKTREQLKAKLMKAFEEKLEEVLDWEEEHPRLRLGELEEYLLEVGEELEGVLAEGVLGQRNNKEPVEAVKCEGCGGVMAYKGQKRRTVVTQMGEIRVERAYYWCAACQRGVFPPG